MSEVKLNSTLTAIDECIMEDTDEPTLTIGQDYKVFETKESMFCITDDTNEPHWFSYHDYQQFFKLKTE